MQVRFSHLDMDVVDVEAKTLEEELGLDESPTLTEPPEEASQPS